MSSVKIICLTSQGSDAELENINCGITQKCKFVFVCFVALRPKSTAMVIAGRSVHLTTLFHGQA